MTAALPLYGHEAAEAAFLSAAASGRLHHAWLIEGPSGIGKARFALRIAAYLLGARGPHERPMDAAASDPVMRSILAGSHPDLNIQTRQLNDRGKLAQDITVEQARDLTEFFTLKPALGGWRVGVIDAIDEANRNATNALLKTLEEPPQKCVLLLVNHGTRPLLPTIRSRCRVVRLAPLSETDCARALKEAGAPEEAARLARGRPGLGLRMSAPGALAAASAAQALIKAMPRPKDNLISAALAAAATGPDAEEAFRSAILEWIAGRAEKSPAMARIWLDLARLSGEASALNMDSAQLAAKLIAGLQEAATSG